ncbi:MAG TPA: acetate--CoA ligase family protein [Mycobacteriales bacterium]|nr:acetate--CoA ligase family protein [Mycobacteriales bacterium]
MAQARTDLERFFHPDGVAVLGRVDREADPEQLVGQHRERYGTDRIFLVNPSGGTVGDVRIYETVADIPGHVDLAVLNVPTKAAPAAAEECGKKGIPFVLVFTSGFSEVGGDGAELERRLGEVARSHGMRVFGPNTNTNAFEKIPDPGDHCGGRIGVLTQSGHQGRPVVQGSQFGTRFSRWVPTGNEVDLEVADFCEYFAHDDGTDVIAAYVEGFRDITKLRTALQAANDNDKPVVMVKIGSTEAGHRMAGSHTGHLTGSDAVVDGLFAQHAVTRVRDLDELLDTASLFAKMPKGIGPGVALYSISGGSCALMSEVADSYGVQLPQLADDTVAALYELLPGYLTVSNPVDNGGTFLFTRPQEDRLKALTLIANDPSVDILVIGITGATGVMSDNLAADIKAFAPTSPVPVVATWNSYKTDEQGFADLVASGVPFFRSFRNCFAALRAYADLQERSKGLRRRHVEPVELPAAGAAALAAGGTLPPGPARDLLAGVGIPIVTEEVVTSPEAATKLAESAGTVVMKIASADFPHKSDLGLVRLGITAADAAATYDDIIATAKAANPDAQIDGVLVQEQVSGGVEMIVGCVRDAVLGPAVMVGTGGVFAEVLRDTAVRPLPLDRQDAEEMVASLRGSALLAGARGRPHANVGALVDVILAVARLAEAAGERLAELDLNPVVVLPDRAVVVDNLVVAASR